MKVKQMKKSALSLWAHSRNPVGYACLLLAGLLMLQLTTARVLADGDDISTMITSLGGYWTAIKVTAIAIVLFVLGRRVIKKI